MEIAADVFVESVNDGQCEGGCGDQRSRRWCEMDTMAQRAVGGVLALFVLCALCNRDQGCVLGGRSLLRGREREREMWCCNRFPWSTFCVLLWRGGRFGLGRLRRWSRFVNFR
jgi:hypothetical protein